MNTLHRAAEPLRAAFVGAALLICGSTGALATVPEAEPPLATIDGHAVTVEDADALRAFLSPPPSREAAERLAVDISLAWWDRHGTLAGSTSKERLTGWREWLVAVDKTVAPGELGNEVVKRLAEIRSRLEAVEAASELETCACPLGDDEETLR